FYRQKAFFMEYEYKKSSIKSHILVGLFSLLFTLYISFWIIRTTILKWNEFSTTKIAFGFSFIILLSLLTYQFLGIPIIRRKYYLLNKTFNIEFDTDKREIRITDKRN